MRVLMIGDIVGKPGRRCVAALLPALRAELRADAGIREIEGVAGA